MSDRDLIEEAIRAGKVRQVPAGVRATRERPPAAHEKTRPEPCGSGHQVHRRGSLSELEGDRDDP